MPAWDRQCSPRTRRAASRRRHGHPSVHAAAHGDHESLFRITQLIGDIKCRQKLSQNDARIPTTLSPREQRKAKNIAFQKQTRERHPNAEPVLTRPRLSVAGQRQIPKFVSARGIPFLRIKKPQPQSLSRIIRYKLRFKDKLIERRDRLHVETLFAKDEEDWDRLITNQALTPRVVYPNSRMEGSWLESPLECYRKAHSDNIEFDKRQQELAEKMWEIVLAERKLAAEEEAMKKETSQTTPSFWSSLIQRIRSTLFA